MALPMHRVVRAQSVLSIAVLSLLAMVACGSDALQHHQACFTPEGSAELCYETLSQSPSLAEKMKGSPGIALRVFGRASNRDVVLLVVSGGPQYPDSWLEQAGRPDCYRHFVDLDRAVAAIEAEELAPELESQRKFAVGQIQFWRSVVAPIDDVEECERVGIDGLIAARAAEDAAIAQQAAAKRR